MATGRTVSKFTKVYIDGYDLTGYSRTAPMLNWGFSPAQWMALDDPAMGALPGQASISLGNYNGILDNTDDGLHDVLASSDAVRDVMIPIGIRADPAAGDPCFCAQVSQNSYQAQPGGGMVTVTIDLGNWDERGDSKAFPIPWGYLLHASGAETGTNTSGTYSIDSGDTGTTLGGYMMYQLFSSDGTVAIKVDDSPDDAAWTTLLTSGDIDASSTPQSGIVATSLTETVDRYLKWRLTFNTASTATFALAFVRGR